MPSHIFKSSMLFSLLCGICEALPKDSQNTKDFEESKAKKDSKNHADVFLIPMDFEDTRQEDSTPLESNKYIDSKISESSYVAESSPYTDSTDATFPKNRPKNQPENYPKNGFFIGLALGSGIIIQRDYVDESYQNAYIKATIAGQGYIGLEYSGGLGYQHYFGSTDLSKPRHGLRFYITYGFSDIDTIALDSKTDSDSLSFITKNQNVMTHRVDVNLDYLLDIARSKVVSAGAIVGMFVGYGHITKATNSNEVKKYTSTPTYNFINAIDDDITQRFDGLYYGINVGSYITFAKRHRLEMLVKIPFTGIKTYNNKVLSRIYDDVGLYDTPNIPDVITAPAPSDESVYRIISAGIGYFFVF